MHSLISRYYPHVTILLIATITFLSLYPVEFPELPGKDKTSHFIAYAACVFPASLARPRHLLWILLAICLWSGVMEFVQPFVNRHKDILDFYANTGGIAIGFVLGWILHRILFNRSK